jgi:hypothetical protein
LAQAKGGKPAYGIEKNRSGIKCLNSLNYNPWDEVIERARSQMSVSDE